MPVLLNGILNRTFCLFYAIDVVHIASGAAGLGHRSETIRMPTV